MYCNLYCIKNLFSWYTVVGNEFGAGISNLSNFSSCEIAVYDILFDVEKWIIAQTAPHKEMVASEYIGSNMFSDLLECEESVFSALSGDNSRLEGSRELLGTESGNSADKISSDNDDID